ncbi:DUF4365 domain-containing protein [Mesorhizobium sp.]|uniref:DUF4365 domain-containing protein n=1 Tax=Mesorhizobium sp. TaxID=1871066 RepID=UPI000FE2EF63|nr:DUF4365 domain-containing protein [Mesorhizobium sp.]RWN98687.1 MAG: DUF4365 domain-containing protein [Mesorhizobium sp.]
MMEDAFPEYADSTELGNKGRRIVEGHIHDSFKWLFREIGKDDLGIDGLVEVIGSDRRARGRVFAVQIKCGDSFFKEQVDGGYVYRGSMEHLNYWLEYSLPVVLILCNSSTRECYWIEINPSSVNVHKKGWSVVVPKHRTLTVEYKYELEWVSRKPQTSDIIAATLYRFLYEKFPGISIAPVLATPHDFCYFDEMARINDGEIILVKFLYKPVEGFTSVDISKVVEGGKMCANACGWAGDEKYQILIVFVAHSVENLKINKDVKKELEKHSHINFVRAIYLPDVIPTLGEIDNEGQHVNVY